MMVVELETVCAIVCPIRWSGIEAVRASCIELIVLRQIVNVIYIICCTAGLCDALPPTYHEKLLATYWGE